MNLELKIILEPIFNAINYIIINTVVKSPNDSWIKNNIKSIFNAMNYIIFHIIVKSPINDFLNAII